MCLVAQLLRAEIKCLIHGTAVDHSGQLCSVEWSHCCAIGVLMCEVETCTKVGGK